MSQEEGRHGAKSEKHSCEKQTMELPGEDMNGMADSESRSYAAATKAESQPIPVQKGNSDVEKLNPLANAFVPVLESSSPVEEHQDSELFFGGLSPVGDGEAAMALYENSRGNSKASSSESVRTEILQGSEGMPGSRTLLLSNIPMHFSDANIYEMAEKYGKVRALDSFSRTSNGYVLLTFYDIRHALKAAECLSTQGENNFGKQFHVAFAPTPPTLHDGLSCDGCISISGISVDSQSLMDYLKGFGEISYSIPLQTSYGVVIESLLVEYCSSLDAQDALASISESGALGQNVYAVPHITSFPLMASNSSTTSLTDNPGSNFQVSVGRDQMYPQPMMMMPMPSMERAQHVWSNQWQQMSPTQYMMQDSPNSMIESSGYTAYPQPVAGGGYVMPSMPVMFSPPYSMVPPERPRRHSFSSLVGKFKYDGEKARSRRGDHQRDHSRSAHYQFNVQEARAGEQDARTTIMIKNIPNKYNQKMLLKILDGNYKGRYDFFYLPIDFKNKCNLGYAFVNFLSSSSAADFYNEFHNHKWGDFNSKKVCEVTYARVQGRQALLEHFKNSRFPSDDISCLPLVFQPENTSDGENEMQSMKAVPIHAL